MENLTTIVRPQFSQLQSDDSCIAIEVKSGRRSQNRGLPLFSEKFHPVHSYIIGTGGIPFETFLQTPVSDLL